MICVFCTQKEIKERMFYKDVFVQAFPTNIPIVPGHILLAPVRCVKIADELKDEEILAIFALVKKMKPVLKKVVGAEGFNFAWNDGEVAGQSVPHIHLHMLPRKTGDTGITKYEPRDFLYRPGSRETTPESELRAIAGDIRKEL